MKFWPSICAAIALVAVVGCHKKPDPQDADLPGMSARLAAGSTGDTMAQLAAKNNIPIYPGAQPDTSHFTATANTGARVFLAYVTTDTPDKVINFYKGNMNLGASTQGAVTELTGPTKDGNEVEITVGQKMDGSGTSISIVVSPPPASEANDVATPAMPNSNPTPAPPAQTQSTPPPSDMTNNAPPASDSNTYYVPTSNSPDDSNQSTDDGSQDQSTGSSNNSQSTDQGTGGQTDQGQGQNQTTTTGSSTGQDQTTGNPPGL